MGIAEFIIGPAEGQTRWPHLSYALLLIGAVKPFAAIRAALDHVCRRTIFQGNGIGFTACRQAKNMAPITNEANWTTRCNAST